MTNNTAVINQSFAFRIFLINWKGKGRALLFFSLVFLAFLLVSYVFQVNSEVAETAIMKNYEAKISELAKENQEMEVNLVKASAIDNIAPLVSELNFEKPSKVSYIRVLGDRVVLNTSGSSAQNQ